MTNRTAASILAFMMALSTAALAGPSQRDRLGLGLEAPLSLAPFIPQLGLSGKYWLDTEHAVDASLFGSNNGLGLGADYLWHRFYIFSGELGRIMPAHVGGGISAWTNNGLSGAAVQGKAGLSYFFKAPFDAFLEIVPQARLYPNFGLQIIFNGGIRFYI